MKSTRKNLIATTTALQAQLAASGHESRKVRAARLAQLTEENTKLAEKLKDREAVISDLNSQLTTLESQLTTLQDAAKAPAAA